MRNPGEVFTSAAVSGKWFINNRDANKREAGEGECGEVRTMHKQQPLPGAQKTAQAQEDPSQSPDAAPPPPRLQTHVSGAMRSGSQPFTEGPEINFNWSPHFNIQLHYSEGGSRCLKNCPSSRLMPLATQKTEKGNLQGQDAGLTQLCLLGLSWDDGGQCLQRPGPVLSEACSWAWER